MAYWVLWQGGDKIRRLEGGNWGGLEGGAFMDGIKLEMQPTLPIQIEIFDKDRTGIMPPVYTVPEFVVSSDVKRVFAEAGVNNIDYYPAIISHNATGESWDNYCVCNIIGLVDAVDHDQSEIAEYSPPDIAALYNHMVIDDAKAQGIQIFRLYTRPGIIMIEDALKTSLEKEKFPCLQFFRPEDFA